jgi:hypothetical protein
MATTFINFTTTPRAFRDDVINNQGKAGASNIAKLTEAEWYGVRALISDAFGMLNAPSIDKTATCSLSLTSGSLVVLQLTC